jgi:hypothetical protein
VNQALGRPGSIVLVRAWHMRCHRTMAAFLKRAPVAGNAFALGEDCYHRGTQADVQLLSHQGVGHGVVVAFDFHGVIDIDPGQLPLGILIGLGRQGPQCGAIE